MPTQAHGSCRGMEASKRLSCLRLVRLLKCNRGVILLWRKPRKKTVTFLFGALDSVGTTIDNTEAHDHMGRIGRSRGNGSPLRRPRGRQPSASAATSYETTTSRGSASEEPPLRSSCQHSVIGSPALRRRYRTRTREQGSLLGSWFFQRLNSGDVGLTAVLYPR